MISETLDAVTDATDGFCALFLDAIQILHKVPLCEEQYAACYFCLRSCCRDRDTSSDKGIRSTSFAPPPAIVTCFGFGRRLDELLRSCYGG